MHEVEIVHEVPFHDVDALDVVWHGHYYKYFELARTALFRGSWLDIADMRDLGYVFPVIESQCRHIHPLFYGSKALIRAKFVETEYRLKVAYALERVRDGKRVARGHTVQVAVKAENGELCMVTPEPVLERLAREPRSLEAEPPVVGPLAINHPVAREKQTKGNR
ncbi:acyl-CoA thioesterase [Acanthopleuribacter pedis]|uniref:Acyl-CoA thioesterase n=1 Tax=Acanthopleuribacter pedis TaxID=442870 RepID=A0A8J7U411_9BACT|nr:thioesterase family protein [Acanthopleuribacter pedis]MBO1318883.1 acyl-CoA thioesterase [Acanthopleuribacter pedis]